MSYESRMLQEVARWNLAPGRHHLPTYLILFVTTRCNARCRTCFYWKELNSPAELDLEELAHTSSSLGHIGWLHLSGGEPFLRDDLAELCQLFYRQNRFGNLAIPTNGLLPQRIAEVTDRIAGECAEAQVAVTLSLDGLAETHDAIRGVPGNFTKAMETYRLLSEVRRRRENLSIFVCSVLCNANHEEMPRLLEFVRDEMEVNFHSVNLIRGEPADREMSLPSAQECRRVLDVYQEYVGFYSRHRAKYGLLGRRVSARTHRLLNDTFFDTAFGGPAYLPCYAGRASCVIEPNGDVRFCELKEPIGNLRQVDFDFERLWHSPQAKALRREIAKVRCRCTHASFQMRNVLLNPRVWPRLLLPRRSAVPPQEAAAPTPQGGGG